jgi:large subunit ribosomal protein L25
LRLPRLGGIQRSAALYDGKWESASLETPLEESFPMPDIALVAEARAERGSSSSRRSRTDGRIPAVIYGHGIDPLPITVEARELRGALNAQARGSVLFNVQVGGASHLVVAREVQRHPVRNTVAHVDFQIVRRDEIISATVAVNLVGEALQVTRAGGVVEHALLHLVVRAKPGDVPAVIEVNIDELEVGQAIRVADLNLPAGVTADLDPEMPVVVGASAYGGLEGAEEEGAATEEELAAAAEEEASGEAASSDEASAES